MQARVGHLLKSQAQQTQQQLIQKIEKINKTIGKRSKYVARSVDGNLVLVDLVNVVEGEEGLEEQVIESLSVKEFQELKVPVKEIQARDS